MKITNSLNQKICPVCNETYYTKYMHCSKQCAAKSPIRNKKRKKTCVEKYGSENVAKSEYFKKKYKSVMNEKYGVDNYFQLTENMKNHYLNKLGATNPQANTEIKNKTLETVKLRYGEMLGYVPKRISEETCLRKYGNKNFFASELGKMSYENLHKNYIVTGKQGLS